MGHPTIAYAGLYFWLFLIVHVFFSASHCSIHNWQLPNLDLLQVATLEKKIFPMISSKMARAKIKISLDRNEKIYETHKYADI